MNYPKKNRFQSVQIAARCLYNIQRENLVFKNSLCICTNMQLYILLYCVCKSFLSVKPHTSFHKRQSPSRPQKQKEGGRGRWGRRGGVHERIRKEGKGGVRLKYTFAIYLSIHTNTYIYLSICHSLATPQTIYLLYPHVLRENSKQNI